ncbi:MAG: helix-hairpin-helix domain-containing protein, partial [Candidatus Hydrogenedentes bacterium]|nr:helix-hairpin-helix domain-containing protein [Candidatus Hydrogenedentota bacterium]
LSDINLAAPLMDGSTLTIPDCGVTGAEEGRLVVRGGRSTAVHNPPQYTISGWQPGAGAHGGPAGADGGAAGTSPGASGLIDLNRATQAELESLPGIGPKLADEIIRFRKDSPFRRVDDLLEVHGIGEKRLAAIRGLVTVGGSP